MADQSLGARMRCWCYNCARVVSSVVSPSSPTTMTCPVCGDGFVESINGSMLRPSSSRQSSRLSRLLTSNGPNGSQDEEAEEFVSVTADPEFRMVPSSVRNSSQEEDEEEEGEVEVEGEVEGEEEEEEDAAHEDEEERGPSARQQRAMQFRLLLHEARLAVERRARSNGGRRSEDSASGQNGDGARGEGSASLEEASAVPLGTVPVAAGGEGSAAPGAVAGARDVSQPLHLLLNQSLSSESGSSELLLTVESQLQELESLLAEVRQDMGVLNGIATANAGRFSQQGGQPGEGLLQAQADEAPEAPELESEGVNEEEQEASAAWGMDQTAWTEFLRLRRQMRQRSPGWMVARNRWLIREALEDSVAPGFDADGDYVHTPAQYQAVLDRLQREAEDAGRTAGGAGSLPACKLAVSALRRVTVGSKTTSSGSSDSSDSSDSSGGSDILAKMKQEGVWDLVCTVCREEVSGGEEVMELPCKHWFHCECILGWFEAHCSCPLCRHLLPAANQVAESSGQGEGRLRRTHTSRRGARVRGLRDLLGEDAGGADPQGESQDAGDPGQEQENQGGGGLLTGIVVPALRVACVVFAAVAVGRRLFGSARQSPLQGSSGQGTAGLAVQARAATLPGEGQRRGRDLALAMDHRPLN